MKKNIIFGAGQYGHEALNFLKRHVKYFIDNNKDLFSCDIDGIPIYPVNRLLKENDEYMVWLASGEYCDEMELQLLEMGVKNYRLFLPKKKLFSLPHQLILNPYSNMVGDRTEKQWNDVVEKDYNRKKIDDIVEKIHHKKIMFRWVELETVNRCNGKCTFCPVSAGKDSRIRAEMSDSVFFRIINQLEEISYSGRLAIFSNNEPFLDKKIMERLKYARKKLPSSWMYLFTNGTLLTFDDVLEMVDILDELVIDNYRQDLSLINISREIENYSKTHPEIADKITIFLRKPDEILTSRAGNAPNRKKIDSYPNAKCMLPYRQLIIRPDGKVSLCCNDALGEKTMGDLSKENILDVWYGEKFNKVRELLYYGRKNIDMCKACDTFYTF